MNCKIIISELKKNGRYIAISVPLGIIIGSLSALFLYTLEWVSIFHIYHPTILWVLPVGGVCIGYMYYTYGKDVQRGNNLLIDEYREPSKVIPLKMAPLILISTLITHLLGGSAGREGTAVQMGGSIADQFNRISWLQIPRKTLLLMGISSGFASVFGTPLAGSIFALEVVLNGKKSFKNIIPVLSSAYIAHFTCLMWPISHTHYHASTPILSLGLVAAVLIAGVASGLTAKLFTLMMQGWQWLFLKINYPLMRPVVGGILIAALLSIPLCKPYIGLGIDTIKLAFDVPLPMYHFLGKIILTTGTLGCGFKGGEVTPLFYIGATLGNALSNYIPVDMSILAAICFIGVFAGATNTPIASTIMGMELFGYELGIFLFITCMLAHYASLGATIYSAQQSKKSIHPILGRLYP